MRIRYLANTSARAILGLILVLGIGMGWNITGHAQNRDDENGRGRNWDRYGNYGGSRELRQTALNAGYNEGVKEGRKDGERNRRTGYRDLGVYEKATKDYSSRLGDRELYRRYFREAFEHGYKADSYDGRSNDRGNRSDRYDRYRDETSNGKQNRRDRNLDGYGNFGGSFQLRQTALNAGFNEGLKQGRNDRNKRNGYQNQGTYQKATKDYSSRLGDREIYRRYFREAYEHGYADGVSGY
jgi:hypothetical protein